LYACGGLTEKGSLRNIKLLRNQETIQIDFYRFLLDGSRHDDLPLQPGDIIHIPLIERAVTIDGEVNRPAKYELKSGENLNNLVDLAGGIKSTGILERIQVKTVTPNKDRRIVDINLNIKSEVEGLRLFDNDEVTVMAVPPDISNFVTLEGAVSRSGIYELKTDITIADLFSEINVVLNDAFLERADLIRFNDDYRTTSIIPFNLEKALDRDPKHNWALKEMDRIIVYSLQDLAFMPPRSVAVDGAVQRPRTYDRHDGMTIKDLLVVSGGLLPDAYAERADLIRYDFSDRSS
jgi:protein involved in polysaccharide export with SLBB domain